MRLKTFLAMATLIVITLSAGTALAQTSTSPTSTPTAQAAAEKPDLRQLKRDISVFSGVVDNTLRESFKQPYGMLQQTKGAYLPGYGLVFSLEVSLVQLRMRSPFDARPLTRQELDTAFKLKQERIGELEHRVLPRMLADYGSTLELPPTDHLAVVIHLFNFPEEDQTELPSRLVAQVSRQDMLDFKAARIPYDEFAKRVELLKF